MKFPFIGDIFVFQRWVPTIASSANISGLNNTYCYYLKIAHVVFCFGQANITPTGAGATTLTLNLPIYADSTPGAFHVSGIVSDTTAAQSLVGYLISNGTIQLRGNLAAGAKTYSFLGAYSLITI